MTTEEKLDELQKKIEEVKTAVDKALAGFLGSRSTIRIKWKESTTPSGIKLEGGATAEVRGTLINVTPIVVGPGAITVMATARRDGTGELTIINGPFEFID